MRRKFEVVGKINDDTQILGTSHSVFKKKLTKEFSAQFELLRQAAADSLLQRSPSDPESAGETGAAVNDGSPGGQPG